jgi:uncharacterized protein YciI
MYFVSLTYLRPLSEIEAHLAQHRDFLDEQFEKGIFLASGAKVPRTGGVFLIRGTISAKELTALIEQDPFKKHGLAQYEVIEFTPSKFHSALSAVL